MTETAAGHTAPLPSEEQRRQLEQIINGAIAGPAPKFYVNGLGFAQTAADVSMILMTHNQAVGVMMMSYTTAKSMLTDLTKILEGFEKATNEKIKTIAELNAEMMKASESAAKSGPLHRVRARAPRKV